MFQWKKTLNTDSYMLFPSYWIQMPDWCAACITPMSCNALYIFSSCCYSFCKYLPWPLARRLHILLGLPGADHGWNGRGGQACKNAWTKDRCQLRYMCCLPVVGLCVTQLRRDLCGHWFIFHGWSPFWMLGQHWTFSWFWRVFLLLTKTRLDFVEVHLSMKRTNPLTLTWPYVLPRRPKL